MLYAAHTNIDYESTGVIQVIGLGDERFEVVDTAVNHMTALRRAEGFCGDYYHVTICYPGQTINWWKDQEDEANAEADEAAAAYFRGLMREYLSKGGDAAEKGGGA